MKGDETGTIWCESCRRLVLRLRKQVVRILMGDGTDRLADLRVSVS